MTPEIEQEIAKVLGLVIHEVLAIPAVKNSLVLTVAIKAAQEAISVALGSSS